MRQILIKLLLCCPLVLSESSQASFFSKFQNPFRKTTKQAANPPSQDATKHHNFDTSLGMPSVLACQGLAFGVNKMPSIDHSKKILRVCSTSSDKFTFWPLITDIKQYDHRSVNDAKTQLKQVLTQLTNIENHVHLIEKQQSTPRPSSEAVGPQNLTNQQNLDQLQEQREELSRERDSLRKQISDKEELLAAAYSGVFHATMELLPRWDSTPDDCKVTIAKKFLADWERPSGWQEQPTLDFLARDYHQINPQSPSEMISFLVHVAGMVADLDDDYHHLAGAFLSQLMYLYSHVVDKWRKVLDQEVKKSSMTTELIQDTVDLGHPNFFNNLHIFTLALAFHIASKSQAADGDLDFCKLVNNNVVAMYCSLLDAYNRDPKLAEALLSAFKPFLVSLVHLYAALPDEKGYPFLNQLSNSINDFLTVSNVNNVSSDYLLVLDILKPYLTTEIVNNQPKVKSRVQFGQSKPISYEIPEPKDVAKKERQSADADLINSLSDRPASSRPTLLGLVQSLVPEAGFPALVSGINFLLNVKEYDEAASVDSQDIRRPQTKEGHDLVDAAKRLGNELMNVLKPTTIAEFYDLIAEWYTAQKWFYKATKQKDKSNLASLQADYWKKMAATSRQTTVRNQMLSAYNQTVSTMRGEALWKTKVKNWGQKVFKPSLKSNKLTNFSKSILNIVVSDLHPDRFTYPSLDAFYGTMGKLFLSQISCNLAQQALETIQADFDRYTSQQYPNNNYDGMPYDLLAFGILMHEIFATDLKPMNNQFLMEIGSAICRNDDLDSTSTQTTPAHPNLTEDTSHWLEHRIKAAINRLFYNTKDSHNITYGKFTTDSSQEIPNVYLNPNQATLFWDKAYVDKVVALTSELSQWIKDSAFWTKALNTAKDGVNSVTGKAGITFGGK